MQVIPLRVKYFQTSKNQWGTSWGGGGGGGRFHRAFLLTTSEVYKSLYVPRLLKFILEWIVTFFSLLINIVCRSSCSLPSRIGDSCNISSIRYICYPYLDNFLKDNNGRFVRIDTAVKSLRMAQTLKWQGCLL